MERLAALLREFEGGPAAAPSGGVPVAIMRLARGVADNTACR
jgi:hypothetical protein